MIQSGETASIEEVITNSRKGYAVLTDKVEKVIQRRRNTCTERKAGIGSIEEHQDVILLKTEN